MSYLKNVLVWKWNRCRNLWSRKDDGIDGILVTVGLCIIALALCVIMKDSMAGFIQTIVESLSDKAGEILNGTGSGG